METYDIVIYPQNIISRKLEVATLKIWQRLCACLADLEVIERQNAGAVDRLGSTAECY